MILFRSIPVLPNTQGTTQFRVASVQLTPSSSLMSAFKFSCVIPTATYPGVQLRPFDTIEGVRVITARNWGRLCFHRWLSVHSGVWPIACWDTHPPWADPVHAGIRSTSGCKVFSYCSCANGKLNGVLPKGFLSTFAMSFHSLLFEIHFAKKSK